MWEFLIKQDSGLYKPKSVGDLNFIEKYYSFDESQSNADAMLGEQIPFEYDGTNVSFVNEASLPDSGTYFPYAQIDCFNNSIMVAASNTVAGAKTDLLSAINTYGVKLVRVIHISTTVPFQPLPSGGGVTPADLALKQDITLATPLDLHGTQYTTVETAIQGIKTELLASGIINTQYVFVTVPANEINTDHWYKIAESSIDKPFLNLSGSIGGIEGEYTNFNITVTMLAANNIFTIQGYIDKALMENCDILLTSDRDIYISLPQGVRKFSATYLRQTNSAIRNPVAEFVEPANVVARMSTSCVNISAGGGGGGNSLNLIQNTPISPDSP